MTEKVITAPSGKYGRIQITLPIQTKRKMIKWMNQSGLKRSEFFRTALMLGAAQLAKQYSDGEESRQGKTPAREEDGFSLS